MKDYLKIIELWNKIGSAHVAITKSHNLQHYVNSQYAFKKWLNKFWEKNHLNTFPLSNCISDIFFPG